MDNILSEMFSRELIMPEAEADSWEEILRQAGDYLYHRGYVKDSYKQALIDREKIYPTGLPTNGIKVALPHTDVIHVIKPGILLINLKRPVVFKEMGNGIRDVPVDMVFVIAMIHAENEVTVLRKLMEMITQEEILRKIKDGRDTEVLYKFLTS